MGKKKFLEGRESENWANTYARLKKLSYTKEFRKKYFFIFAPRSIKGIQ